MKAVLSLMMIVILAACTQSPKPVLASTGRAVSSERMLAIWIDAGGRLDSFCRETLEMGVFQGVRAYAEALEWLSWLRSGTDQEGKKVSRRVRGGRNRHK